jgi:hypothetical protein
MTPLNGDPDTGMLRGKPPCENLQTPAGRAAADGHDRPRCGTSRHENPQTNIKCSDDHPDHFFHTSFRASLATSW